MKYTTFKELEGEELEFKGTELAYFRGKPSEMGQSDRGKMKNDFNNGKVSPGGVPAEGTELIKYCDRDGVIYCVYRIGSEVTRIKSLERDLTGLDLANVKKALRTITL